jgi:hypothetical protein
MLIAVLVATFLRIDKKGNKPNGLEVDSSIFKSIFF